MDSDSETEHVVVSAVMEPAPIPEKKDTIKGQGRTDLWSQEVFCSWLHLMQIALV